MKEDERDLNMRKKMDRRVDDETVLCGLDAALNTIEMAMAKQSVDDSISAFIEDDYLLPIQVDYLSPGFIPNAAEQPYPSSQGEEDIKIDKKKKKKKRKRKRKQKSKSCGIAKKNKCIAKSIAKKKRKDSTKKKNLICKTKSIATKIIANTKSIAKSLIQGIDEEEAAT